MVTMHTYQLSSSQNGERRRTKKNRFEWNRSEVYSSSNLILNCSFHSLFLLDTTSLPTKTFFETLLRSFHIIWAKDHFKQIRLWLLYGGGLYSRAGSANFQMVELVSFYTHTSKKHKRLKSTNIYTAIMQKGEVFRDFRTYCKSLSQFSIL